MATEAQILRLTQWLSPAFPIGAFAWSHGLEAALNEDQVTADTVEDWLRGVLTLGGGWADAVLLAAAYRAKPSEVSEVDAIARAMAPSAERLAETLEQGTAFARTVSDVWPGGRLPALCYPVALGHAGALHDLPLDLTATLYLQAFAAALTSAASRLVPLGQTHAQAILSRLTELCPEVAKSALSIPLDEISSQSFAADIAAMRHETQYSRLFRS
ncbi:urease accessory UreF family protein [Vannielia sp.]|uniref:urease accessory protein UreF n=1 Tax=Vannielia sp. TaxID=2813045 RepID=UPI0026033DB8|nr:urease accessory UreF family protein [Vannielia sp.]MDF1872198.1 urease accessory UreF family protein [Vannielia sp.]